jgi:hypothetical protein
MIFIFGDSWARHSATHIDDKEETLQTSSAKGIPLKNITRYGYRHWKFDHVFVEFNMNDWFSRYFKKNTVINFGEGGNTNSWILENLHTRMAGVANVNEPITVIVYQTDPMRIFAPRKDYTNRDIVWPIFLEWCESNQFDYSTRTVNDLINTIFEQFYKGLAGFKAHAKNQYNLDVNLQLVGGVNAVQPLHAAYDIPVLIKSVSEFFGHTDDTVIENHLALHRLIGWWGEKVSSEHRNTIMREWQEFDKAVTRKTSFWVANPEHFAGRHLTATALTKLANYIESKIDQANL